MKKVNVFCIVVIIAAVLGLACSCTLDNPLDASLDENGVPSDKTGLPPVSENPDEVEYPPAPEEPKPEDLEMGNDLSRMQNFIIGISSYARKERPGFIVIPQNAEELSFNEGKLRYDVNPAYINAIDGIGIEELFYDGSIDVDDHRVEMLSKLKDSVKIMVADYVENDNDVSDSIDRSLKEGFIAFPRRENNYDYAYIPPNSDIKNENANDIARLKDAQNYLYLISDENYDSKKEMIAAISATNYDVVIIDLFYGGDDAFTEKELDLLKKKRNGSKRLVIAYISVGSAENYRYYWKNGWEKGNPSFLKKEYDGYPDEFWVEYWDPAWRNIIYGNKDSYIQKIIDAGFDGAYLDNVEAHERQN